MSLEINASPARNVILINSLIVYFTYGVLITGLVSCIILYTCGKRRGVKGSKDFTIERSTISPNNRRARKSHKKSSKAGDAVDEGDSAVSRAEEGTSAANNQISEAFDELFAKPVVLTLHGPKGPLKVNVRLEKDQLIISNTKSQNSRTITFNLREVDEVIRGARVASSGLKSAQETADEVASRKGRAIVQIPDDQCFTLVNYTSGNLDFQATSKIECDALVDGFERKVDSLQ